MQDSHVAARFYPMSRIIERKFGDRLLRLHWDVGSFVRINYDCQETMQDGINGREIPLAGKIAQLKDDHTLLSEYKHKKWSMYVNGFGWTGANWDEVTLLPYQPCCGGYHGWNFDTDHMLEDIDKLQNRYKRYYSDVTSFLDLLRWYKKGRCESLVELICIAIMEHWSCPCSAHFNRYIEQAFDWAKNKEYEDWVWKQSDEYTPAPNEFMKKWPTKGRYVTGETEELWSKQEMQRIMGTVSADLRRPSERMVEL